MNFNSFSSSNPGIIAELACGHEGDINKFYQLVDIAKKSGAKIVKSQIFIPEERVVKEHSEWDLFNRVCLSQQDWEKASKYIQKQKMFFFADIFGYAGLKISKKLKIHGYKIHSEDLLNSYFIRDVAKLNKILMIGVGGAHRKEVYELLSFLKKEKCNEQIILMPGIQRFPTPIDLHSLNEISDLNLKYSKEFNVKIGCADHISGDFDDSIIFPLAALAAGACFIEKHLTKDRKLKWEDYESALDQYTFPKFIDKVKVYSNLLIDVGPQNDAEKKYRIHFKKIPIAYKNINNNKIIKEDDIRFEKHEKLKTPLSAIEFINKKSNQNIKKGQPIFQNLISNNVGCVLVARNTSDRLPNKAIKKILGKETIRLLIERIKRVKNIDKFILATSTHESDNSLVKIAKEEKIHIFRGSLDNLSKRFYDASNKFKLDHIVRVTGDDILRDELMIEKAINSHLKNSCDVTITTNMPYGTQSEIFTFNTIKLIMKKAFIKKNTEYLEWFLQNDRYFSVNYVPSKYKFDNSWRITLDYKEDLIFFRKIFENLYKKNKHFTLEDTLKFLYKNSNIAKINISKNPKFNTIKTSSNLFYSDKIDTTLKI